MYAYTDGRAGGDIGVGGRSDDLPWVQISVTTTGPVRLPVDRQLHV